MVDTVAEKQKPLKDIFPMQQLSKQPAFVLGEISATPGALADLQKGGTAAGASYSRAKSTSIVRRWRASCRSRMRAIAKTGAMLNFGQERSKEKTALAAEPRRVSDSR